VDPQIKESADGLPDEGRRFERRLARGLEDISHLFLSQPVDKNGDNPVPAETAASEPGHNRPPILLRAFPSFNRELLISLLSRNASVLEKGLCVIDTNVPCDPFGAIDLVALDGTDSISIIDAATEQNDELLLRGIAHFDWFARNIPIVRRMYQGRVINFSVAPRLVLLAPGFSPLSQCVARRSESPRICGYIYRTAAVSGGAGILFENGLGP
jgi:hypothetical protein